MGDLLDKASDLAFAALEKAGGDMEGLPPTLRTVVVIYSAQGVIDNGGFKYFFEQDFDKNPPYSLFSEAYQQVGAESAASLIEEAANLFPFEDPHLHQKRRQTFLMDESSPDSLRIQELGDQLCGDETIWKKLEQYIIRNRTDFKL